MIQQKLTKTKTKMILITKTLVIFPRFTLQHDDIDHQIVKHQRSWLTPLDWTMCVVFDTMIICDKK